MLYPLKFTPITKKKIWGEEIWTLSAYGQDLSIVTNGYLAGNDLQELTEVYMGDLVGDKVYELYGGFPLLIKTITANDNLSIQVHPDDEYALENCDSLGKDEMWYVLNAKENAKLLLGFSKEMDEEQLYEALDNGKLLNCINQVPVNQGDVAFLPAGLVHSLGAGVQVIEVQESSDITYRVYDYDRLGDDGQPRELHIDKALEVMNFSEHKHPLIHYKHAEYQDYNDDKAKSVATSLIHANHFITKRIVLAEKDYIIQNDTESFIVLIGVKGKVNVHCENDDCACDDTLEAGETMLIPALFERVTIQGEAGSRCLNEPVELLQVTAGTIINELKA